MIDRALAHRRQQFMRPDAWRYLKPGAEGYDPPPGVGYQEPAHYRRAREAREADEAKAAAAQAEADERAFQRELGSIRFELAMLRLALKARRARQLRLGLLLAAKAGFDPGQPRVPAGNPDGGQWTDAGGGGGDAGSSFEQTFSAASRPRIPRERPPTSPGRSAVYKLVAGWLAETGIEASEAIAKTSWVYHALPTIRSYLDAPRTLGELQADLSSKAGYDVHHIVERSSALDDGFPRSRINDDDNLVRIPRMKHWEVNAWYQTKNPAFGNVSPRDYLRGKDWDERRRVGLMALSRYGVLRQ